MPPEFSHSWCLPGRNDQRLPINGNHSLVEVGGVGVQISSGRSSGRE